MQRSNSCAFSAAMCSCTFASLCSSAVRSTLTITRPRTWLAPSAASSLGTQVAALLAWRQLDVVVGDLLVRNQGQEVVDQVQVRRALVVGLDHVPRGLGDVGIRKHLVFGF